MHSGCALIATYKTQKPTPDQQANPTSESTETPAVALEQARTDLSTMNMLSSGVASGVENVQSMANAVSPKASTWEPLLANVKIVARVLESISEVRVPYDPAARHPPILTRFTRTQKWRPVCCPLSSRLVSLYLVPHELSVRGIIGCP